MLPHLTPRPTPVLPETPSPTWLPPYCSCLVSHSLPTPPATPLLSAALLSYPPRFSLIRHQPNGCGQHSRWHLSYASPMLDPCVGVVVRCRTLLQWAVAFTPYPKPQTTELPHSSPTSRRRCWHHSSRRRSSNFRAKALPLPIHPPASIAGSLTTTLTNHQLTLC